MTGPRRTPRRRAIVTTTVVAPLIAIGSLTAVALAQTPPAGGPVPAAAFRFAEEAARDLAKARMWAGPRDAVALSRDATRRDLVVLMQPVLGLPAGPIGAAWNDVAPDDPQGAAAKRAVERGWLTAPGGALALDAPLTGWDANRAWTLGLGMGRAVSRLGQFRDGAGRRFALPEGFATSITAREAGLRRNYPASDDSLERHDSQPIRLADLVLMAARGRAIRRGGLPSSVRALQAFRIPAVDPMFVPTVQRALALVGNPYVWGGEWPDPNSPLDRQASGGFDCSGIVWYVWTTGDRAAEASINMPSGRTTYTMNVGKRGKRIAWQAARAGDLVFFGGSGRRTPMNQASHMSISLGNKWIIHSSGGRGGVSISWLPTYWPSGLMNARSFRVSDTTPPAKDQPTTTPTPVTTPEPATPVPAPPSPGGVQAPPPAPAPGGTQPPAPG
jgi:cell wall-associated NlpC family hydrolase